MPGVSFVHEPGHAALLFDWTSMEWASQAQTVGEPRKVESPKKKNREIPEKEGGKPRKKKRENPRMGSGNQAKP